MPRKPSKYQELLAKQTAAANFRANDASASLNVANEDVASSTSSQCSVVIDPDMEMGLDSSDSSDDSVGDFEDPPPDKSDMLANFQPPVISYFELRRDKDKKAYVESFADILGKVKTNYHFRCKGCGDTFVGQYLNMLVHMSGTYNHLSVRARACSAPIPAMKAKILQDYADYNSKQQLMMTQIKQEPGAFSG